MLVLFFLVRRARSYPYVGEEVMFSGPMLVPMFIVSKEFRMPFCTSCMELLKVLLPV